MVAVVSPAVVSGSPIGQPPGQLSPDLAVCAFVQYAVGVLKHHGYRVTRPRQRLLQLLEDSHQPLSPYEMSDRLNAQEKTVDTVSIYRILECLEQLGLVHKVASTGKYLRCHSTDPTLHDCAKTQQHTCLSCHDEESTTHYLLVCDGCGHTDELLVSQPLTQLSRLAQQQRAFQVRSQSLEMRGLCRLCGEARV